MLKATSGSWRKAARLGLLVAVMGPVLTACGAGGVGPTVKRSAFTSKEFGVAVSPRVTTNPNPPKGGGRYLVGKPYTVRGKTYAPQENPAGYVAEGTASWYGADFHGRRTANGEIFSANGITGAHPTLPLPSYVRVTNVDNGRSVTVRVNDRGPYMHGRVMDLSWRAADILGYVNRGTGNVAIEYVGPAPLEGDDTRMLLASVSGPAPVDGSATRVAALERPTTLVDGFFGLLGYAGESPVNAAHAAAEAMATRSEALDDWVAAADEEARTIRLQLGVFREAASIERIALAFAPLAAVTEERVALGSGDAARLTLTQLKPGVARRDVLEKAQELGLRDIVLY